MSTLNTKAGATQLQEDIAAEDAAAQQQETTTPVQEQTGTSDQTGQEQTAQSTEGATGEQESAGEQQQQEEQDIITQPVAVEPTAPVAKSAPAVVVMEAAAPVAADAALHEKLAGILKDVPAAHQTDIGRILTYLERMAPKRPVDVKSGVTEQVALYKAIQNIINRQGDYFTQLFSALLFIFKSEARGALSDRYRCRFMDNITLAVGDRKAFVNLTQMLAILADPKSRELAMKQVHMERALENGLTVEGRTRVLHYFGV
ncbi:hypothetical protein [Ralstonia phage RP31]|uniref:Uncharacterized protein n=2 Tax=Ripduovirus RP12 TaxID=2560700 RepID=A0A1L7N189_9CAUD|nr:hypothetical protein FDH28_gp157 [Ralstonia phage RP12]BAW19238.1 hypothetical protein [Ralstonia phage RP12]BAW19524.1 hypothetical protein [Ralstonia phage RP31]